MKPHKHAELIKAWADGKRIQTRCLWLATDEWSEWADTDFPAWHLSAEYRIKPEPKPDVETFLVNFQDVGWKEKEWRLPSCESIKLIRDGETGEPKSAEVLK